LATDGRLLRLTKNNSKRATLLGLGKFYDRPILLSRNWRCSTKRRRRNM